MKKTFLLICFCITATISQASYMLVPMDESQKEHLKAYGIAYWILDKGVDAYWLLNYRGGSFAFPHTSAFERECLTRNVSFEVIPDAKFNAIREEIGNQEINQEVIKLEVAPQIAVYTPDQAKGEKVQPWDDAVTLVLTYAEIPYETVYDQDVLDGKLAKYDWLHLHHEDFTGQYGKFFRNYHNQPWYRDNQMQMEALAKRNGFSKVSHLKLAVVKEIKEYVGGGGFMFAMCSATDTYDIALAAEGLDICDKVFDGDPPDLDAEERLDFSKTFAFEDFTLVENPLEYEHASIDNKKRKVVPQQDYFTLFDFSAKWDPVPTMLTQCHTRTIKGFMGQTTSYDKRHIKSNVLILGDFKGAGEARYIHSTFGEGFWTFYGGHDPEDYRHYIHDPDMDLSLHPNSPGYRLILNNVLFPAAKKKKRKT